MPDDARSIFHKPDHLASVFPEQSAAVRRWRTDPMFAPLHGTEPR